MGIQGPLTAQALGRSPYDQDVVPGEGEDDPNTPNQQYDSRGRPINPETKRINRDIVRAHNEVMLVVGVAEPDNPHAASELEEKRQHYAYESHLGQRMIWATNRCFEMVGVFGVAGLRQRLLVYSKFSQIPCYELWQSRWDLSPVRDMFPGVPSSLLAHYIERRFLPPWTPWESSSGIKEKMARYCWKYFQIHLELFAIYQRLGLVSRYQLLPTWRFFIPFTQDSPINPMQPLTGYTPSAIMQWVGGVFISAAPVLAWAAIQSLWISLRPFFWGSILPHLPNPMRTGRGIEPLPPPVAQEAEVTPAEQEERAAQPGAESEAATTTPSRDAEDHNPTSPEDERSEPPVLSRRQSTVSAGINNEYDSDDDLHDVVSATLISFDVEATEATDLPQGLWSAELRPSTGPENSRVPLAPIYLATELSNLPSVLAAKVLSYSVIRVVLAPAEAMTLRLIARSFCLRNGLPVEGIQGSGLLQGANFTWLVNFLCVELTWLSLSGEIWSAASAISTWLHKSEEEWKEFEGKEWGDWLGPWFTSETYC
ncbi:uncharacterized protein F5Z01DRAFT_653073 [Emericellopsis atlantica]|uniref:Uncharacterized protein n=1 Tax=Emericellopsis atlantica TaxID=2614577 RepID=A0A9P7ZNL0_9HYPO|nr:uncharacterized protein F5Z01DRAFT_653073 [Emericellopsis atlantica]KAG9255424.1 hypothetical protein F5Z01DRAFT_653073 [Emericellopsis atlantica]